jgi:uncharacterized protein (TIGR03382 family)
MRRALLLATLLAAPSLAAAQAVGSVLFANSRINPNTINAVECDPANQSQVLVQWNPSFINNQTSVPVGGTYIIYGSNTAPTGTQCVIADNTTGGQNIRANVVQNTNLGATSATIATATLVGVAGLGCSDGQNVFICVQGVVSGTNNTTTNFAIASASITISTSIPKIPVVTGISPGDRALNVSWEPGTAGTATAKTVNVELEATLVDTVGNPIVGAGTLTSPRFGASPARFEKLVNGQGYAVRARAFSDADNVSTTFSPAVIGTPQPVNDFWDTYKAEGGRDTGGCSSGLAGPLGLGVLIATLALARRRK